MNNYKELIEQFKNGEITEEELYQLMSDDKGWFRLKRGKITKTGEDKKKLFFGGTIIGYKDEIDAPFNFLPGSHEEAAPHFAGIPYLLFHNDNMIPIGKVSESWFDDEEVKYAAWSHDEKYNDAIIDNMMLSQSMGFEPTDYEFNIDTWEYDIKTYRPTEMSGLVFPAYGRAQVEEVGETLEEVKQEMIVSTTLSNATITTIPEQSSVNDTISVTTNATDTDWTVITSDNSEEVKEMEKLRKENKMLKFLAKHPNIQNREQIEELMEKYDLSEEDAEKIIVEQEEVIVEPTVEVAAPIENPPLPTNNEPVPTGDPTKEDRATDIEARIADSEKRGFGTK
jgi:hypothetical protein